MRTELLHIRTGGASGIFGKLGNLEVSVVISLHNHEKKGPFTTSFTCVNCLIVRFVSKICQGNVTTFHRNRYTSLVLLGYLLGILRSRSVHHFILLFKHVLYHFKVISDIVKHLATYID